MFSANLAIYQHFIKLCSKDQARERVGQLKESLLIGGIKDGLSSSEWPEVTCEGMLLSWLRKPYEQYNSSVLRVHCNTCKTPWAFKILHI